MVDFDGSFWRVIGWDSAERPSSLISEKLGSIRLIDHQRAEFREWEAKGLSTRLGTASVDYRGRWGTRIQLERIDGPIVLESCY
jgi:hypothetical protein